MDWANYRPARPRTADEIAGLPGCPDVVTAAAKRCISQVVHFTTLIRCDWHIGIRDREEPTSIAQRPVSGARVST